MPTKQLMWKNGTHTIKETGVEGQFCFYRDDKQVLGNVGIIDIWLFLAQEAQDYLNKGGQKKEICLKGITSDGKGIIFTLLDQVEKSNPSSSAVKPRPHFLKRLDYLFKEYFG